MKSHALFDPAIVRGALIDSLRKLDPRHQARNPVMFVVMVGSVLTTALGYSGAIRQRGSAGCVHSRHQRLALVHCALWSFCRSHGGRPRQGSG